MSEPTTDKLLIEKIYDKLKRIEEQSIKEGNSMNTTKKRDKVIEIIDKELD